MLFRSNSDLAVIECWSGSAWVRISGDPRGKVDMWSGSVATIPTGWVLADGVTRTHPEGGTYTPPDLRNRFIVGAGQDGGTYTPGHDAIAGTGYYAPGATGGEDKHTLTIPEMPSHSHGVPVGCDSGGPDGQVWSVKTWVVSSYSTNAQGGSQQHENRPLFYSLCYLYKL